MSEQQYEEALRAIIKLGDELLVKTKGMPREQKAWCYVQHADAVEALVRKALKK